MSKTVWWIPFAAISPLLHFGCDTPGQRNGAAAETSSQREASAAAFFHQTDTIVAFIPEVIYEMPSRRVRSLAELVDFNKLAVLLPDSLPNMRRDDIIAERAIEDSVMIALAAGSYADRAGNNIEIRITDPGDLRILAPVLYPWLVLEVQSQSENGYERTIWFEGYRGFERYYQKDQSGEMYVIVGDRFVVEATGYGVPCQDLKNAMSHIDLRKLEALRAHN